MAHPILAISLWTANFYLWHLPALYQGAVEHDAVHALQHLLFVAFGIGMWMALLGPLPKPAWFGNGAKIGYIVAVRLIQSVLANALLWSSGVLYPRYAAGERYWGITPANDQSAAGAIMMIEGSIVTILLFCWLFLRAAKQSDEKQALVELAAARGVELSEERAARAVSAGRGDALRERILSESAAELVRRRGLCLRTCRRVPPPSKRPGPWRHRTCRRARRRASRPPRRRRTPVSASLPAAVRDCWRIHGLRSPTAAGG